MGGPFLGLGGLGGRRPAAGSGGEAQPSAAPLALKLPASGVVGIVVKVGAGVVGVVVKVAVCRLGRGPCGFRGLWRAGCATGFA